MKDAFSFDVSDEGLERAYQAQRDAYERIFTRLGVEYVIVKADAGAMGGSASEEFLSPSPIGEDTFVRSPGGYAANVEAVVTPAPPAQSIAGLPAAVVHDSPNTPTIATLVALANDRVKRADGREWTAADTLKNVVLALTSPEGKRSLVMVGVPGDREVEAKRAEAAFAPNEVEQATEEDFAKNPELVKGYIGPKAGGFKGIKYFVDPRVVEGTAWITGANQDQKHVFDFVFGRDFEADGIRDIAEVKAGDPAPDGSGPLELARGIEIGHVFQLGRKYAEALGLQVLDENGKLVTVTMGSYGIGVTRILAVIAETNNDDRGLIWPLTVSPFHVHVVATGKDDEALALAESLSAEFEVAGFEVVLDDRPKVSPGVKFGDAELIGVPLIVIAGRGAADGIVEVWDRRTGERNEIPAAEALAWLRSVAQ
jgi:prolyl-tRNA synthetase